MNAGSYGDKKRVLYPWELELQVVMSCLTWTLETERSFSAKQAPSAFNSSTISSVLMFMQLFYGLSESSLCCISIDIISDTQICDS